MKQRESWRTAYGRCRSPGETCVGVDLAKYAFSGPDPHLKVSDIGPEQEAAHLLYRGVFGFVRNSVHHRLIETLQPERALQIVGMVDYLISVAEAAQREFTDEPKAGT